MSTGDPKPEQSKDAAGPPPVPDAASAPKSPAQGAPGGGADDVKAKLLGAGNRVYFHLDIDVNGWMILGAVIALLLLLKL